jgi:hypothetical protein
VKFLSVALVAIVDLCILTFESLSPVYGQNVLTTDQFQNALTACATQQNIQVGQDVVNLIGQIYADQVTRSALSDPSILLPILPEKDRLTVYKLYVQCITKVLPQDLRPQQQATVVYKVCTGEYERACPVHDVYLYCYADVGAWAKSRCSSSTIQRVTTFGVNKCGYSLDTVICTGIALPETR